MTVDSLLTSTLLLLALAAAAPGQTPPAPDPRAPDPRAPTADPRDSNIPQHGLVATVNGEAITMGDVRLRMEVLKATMVPDETVTEEELALRARRELAEEILLAAEATRLGLILSDLEVKDYWAARLGHEPDFETSAQAAGTTVPRQIELARRAALSKLYIDHRSGLASRYTGRVPPDPVLVRLVNVTPGQLREAFTSQRDYYVLPELVHFDVFLCRDTETAREVAGTLRKGESPTSTRMESDTAAVPALDELFTPQAAEFLRTASGGDISDPVEVVGNGRLLGVLVFRLGRREPGRPATWEEVQNEIRFRVQRSRLEEARAYLVRGLIYSALYGPDDLF